MAVERFLPFEPAEVLYEFDRPRIFTCKDADNETYLVYWSDEDDDVCRYVVVPTAQRIVNGLRQGTISVHEALDQPRCWLCDVNHRGELVQCQRVEFEDIPRDCLPSVETMLLPTHRTIPSQAR